MSNASFARARAAFVRVSLVLALAYVCALPGVARADERAWPGRDRVVVVDAARAFGGNLSGLAYQAADGVAPAVLWAVRNGPSTLYQLIWNGSTWAVPSGREAGTSLRYADGTGAPDAEGVTLARNGSPFLYVVAERDNDDRSVSRSSVLRFDTRRLGSELAATHEWDLTPDLPASEANVGLEAIAFYPDEWLTEKGFLDESTGLAYVPSRYPDHGDGLFFVGAEGTGTVYAYALDHARGDFQRIASFASGQAGVMDLTFDRDTGLLWAQCDDTCGNQVGVLDVDSEPSSVTFGRFVAVRRFARPSSMPNINNEGIAFGPDSACIGGFKPFFWSDDSETDGHALRADSLPCDAGGGLVQVAAAQRLQPRQQPETPEMLTHIRP